MSGHKVYHIDSEHEGVPELERAREALKASIRAMATLLGVVPSTYWYWLNGTHAVPDVALVAARGLIAQHRLYARDVSVLAKVEGKGAAKKVEIPS